MEPYDMPRPADGIVFSIGHYAAMNAQHPVRAFFRQVLAPRFWLFATLSALVIGMQLAFQGRPEYGVYATMAVLVVCIVIAARSPAARPIAVATGVIPLSYMVALCVSAPGPLARISVLYAMLLVLGMVYRLQLNRVPRPKGLPAVGSGRPMRILPGVVLLGQALGVLSYLTVGGLYPYGSSPVVVVLAAALVFASIEELFFRGLVQAAAARVFHPAMAAALSAVLYATLTIGTGSWMYTGVGLVGGAVLSTVYYKTQSVVLTIVLNMVSKVVFIGALATFSWGYF